MGADCSSQSCETASRCDDSSCGSSQGKCPCGSDCGGDPVACATAMWSSSFFVALKQAQVELLKAKIQKAWGPKMDKAADAALEAMGVQWQSMLAQAKAKGEFEAKLRALWNESK